MFENIGHGLESSRTAGGEQQPKQTQSGSSSRSGTQSGSSSRSGRNPGAVPKREAVFVPCGRMHSVCAPYVSRIRAACAPSLYDVALYFTLAQNLITEKCRKYSCFSWGLSCGVPKAAGLAMASTPEWASKQPGDLWPGFVDDFETVLSQHRTCTVTTYGVRRSRSNASSPSTTSGTGKENESANKPPNKVNAKNDQQIY